MQKECKKCKDTKALDEFVPSKNCKDGYRNTCKSCNAGYYRDYYSKNPERYREKAKNQKPYTRHGLTEQEYLLILNKFDGMCHLCRAEVGTKIDHDHNCCAGSRGCKSCVRGILCSACNAALGMLKDDIIVINRIENYLRV